MNTSDIGFKSGKYQFPIKEWAIRVIRVDVITKEQITMYVGYNDLYKDQYMLTSDNNILAFNSMQTAEDRKLDFIKELKSGHFSEQVKNDCDSWAIEIVSDPRITMCHKIFNTLRTL